MIHSTRQALILFAHGARDPRWAEPLARIRQLVMAQLGGAVPVHLAFLELMSPSLAEVVVELVADQVTEIRIIPIFLGQGGHVRKDLPELVQKLEVSHPDVAFTLCAAIGENDQVLNAIANVCVAGLLSPRPN